MTNLTVKETSKIFEKFRKYGKNAQITCLYFSVKPFQTGGFNLSVPKISAAIPSPSPAWLGRSIATSKLRLLEHSAFVDQQRETDSYHKHLFVHIGGNYEYSDPSLEVGVSLAGGVSLSRGVSLLVDVSLAGGVSLVLGLSLLLEGGLKKYLLVPTYFSAIKYTRKINSWGGGMLKKTFFFH